MSAKQRSKQTDASAAGMQMWHVAIAVVVAAAAVPAYLFYYAVPAEVQPLRAKKLTDLAQFTKEYRDSMLWGSYRSGLYFGMRTRAPKSLLAGLVWFDPDAVETLMQQRVRYKANQDDGLQQYGWVRHDGRTWGRQIIIDGSYNITLTMVKHQAPGGGAGGDWALRAHVTRGKGHEPNGIRRKRISLLLYLTDEDKPKNSWAVLPQGEPDTLREPVQLIRGGNKVVGDFSLHVVESGPSRKVHGRLNYLGMMSVEGERDFRHEVNNLMLSIIYENMQRNPMSDVFHMELPNGAMTDSDLAMFQVTIPVGGTTDWVFLSHGRGPLDDDVIEERVAALSGDALTQIINERDAEFDQRFAKTFPVASPVAQDGPSEAQVQEVAKAALSNLLGSMGYFYGRSKIRLPGRSEPVLYWPAALFTAVPSRSFFPRGFLWDEGFHQLLVNRWDPLLSREVLSYWLDLMNSQGWIPREQILGVEATQRVPAEFVVQNPHHANPPSLFLPISNMAQMLHADGGPKSGSHTELREFLLAAWPRLEAWYQWYNTTQLGQLPGSYRWRGREEAPPSELNPKTLTSGLDDYPRASHPSQDERHLDLRCWMALASQAMASIATSLGLDSKLATKYTQTAERLADMPSLDAQHWDEARQQYLDWGMHTEAVRLKKTRVGPPGQTQDMMVRVVDRPPTPQYVPHFGYVSLFPLLMRLLPADSPRLGVLLNQLRDSALLWTPYGLRSLSAESTLYKQYNTEHDPPYWRGQIWININYLTLASLRHYGSMPGPNQEAAAQLEVELQAAITKGLVSQYYQQGYLYEQYDDSTGHGKSSHPFTGWTALITLIATGTY